MIGDVNHPNGNGKTPFRVAIERFVIVFFYAVLTVLIASLPGIPNVEKLYAAVLVGLLAGIGSYAIARQIQVTAGR